MTKTSVHISGPHGPFGQAHGRGLADRNWTMGCAPLWEQARAGSGTAVLDLSNIGFVPLFEWLTAVAQIETIVSCDFRHRVAINPVGGHSELLLTRQGLRREREKLAKSSGEVDTRRISFSKAIHDLMGFVDSLDTLSVLNRPDPRRGTVEYNAPGQGFYTNPESPTLVLGVTRVSNADDCRQFLDRELIRQWRDRMDTRFRNSPLFESDMTWRVFCHELAINTLEHAGSPGFLSARVVEHRNSDGTIRDWVRATWPDHMDIIEDTQLGFLEICVADMGPGIAATLGQAYHRELERRRLSTTGSIPAEDILAFAFDEFGTSKKADGRWRSDVHALGRILQLVSRYGGVVNLRSSGVELSYEGRMQWFSRFPDKPGYEPTCIKPTTDSLPGTQIQVLLPLVPRCYNREAPDLRPTLERSLPKGFRTEPDKAHGLFLPLEPCNLAEAGIGSGEQLSFQDRCHDALAQLLHSRSKSEAVVIDFTGVQWTAAQFETFMRIAQNWVQHRPVLLVEMPLELAEEIVAAEDDLTFLEGYKDPDCVMLAVDTEGTKYLLGLRDRTCEKALLDLIADEPLTTTCLRDRFPAANERVLNAILTHANPLFEMVKGGWRCTWTNTTIANEKSRALVRHFDIVAEKCGAWSAKRIISEAATAAGQNAEDVSQDGKKSPAFNLPWQSEWRTEFLESSRMLSRERLADEAAFHLVHRVEIYLSSIGKSMRDIALLACVTTPAILLATAMRKRWPVSDPGDRPVVADFGYYVMLKNPADRPSIKMQGNALIVQDVLDTRVVSNELISFLDAQHVPVLGVVALAHLSSDVESTQLNAANAEWTESASAVPTHSMLLVPRPIVASRDRSEPLGAEPYWVEPRALRPVSYAALRKPLIPRTVRALREMDREGLLVQGHYVYGTRHYGVVADIPKLIDSHIGDEIAAWLADVCEGKPHGSRTQASWDVDRSANGPVNIVLMPLHSQIHHLWSKVECLLAQRGVRQPAWLLDATLFSGRGPAYKLPPQVGRLIDSAVKDSWELRQSENVGSDTKVIKKPLRILILDDDIASARTAETILTTIHDRVRSSYKKRDKRFVEHSTLYPRAVEWIRYFTILNQMGFSRNMLWHRGLEFRDPRLPVVLEDYAPFIGTPVYTEYDCPACQEQQRLRRLENLFRDSRELKEVVEWASEKLKAVQTIAIDVPDFSTRIRMSMDRPIYVTGTSGGKTGSDWPLHADTAIWQFHELMYRSYPPSDILRVLGSTNLSAYSSDIAEYERYEWAVMEWCLRNWPRVKADAAQDHFLSCFRKLIDRNSQIVERVLEAAAEHYEEAFVQKLIGYCQDELVAAERAQVSCSAGKIDPKNEERALVLKRGLELFWFSVPHHARDPKEGCLRELLATMKSLTEGLGVLARESYIGLLCRTLERSKVGPGANPDWALLTVAECLHRARHHRILPHLLQKAHDFPKDRRARSQLKGNLLEFLSALRALCIYYELEGSGEVIQKCEAVLKWLGEVPGSNTPEVDALYRALDKHKPFCRSFDEQLHMPLCELADFVAQDKPEGIEWRMEESPCSGYPVLAPWGVLCECVANLTTLPVRDYTDRPSYQSLVRVVPSASEGKPQEITLRLLTQFAPPEIAEERIWRTGNNAANRITLELFGVRLSKPSKPLSEEPESAFECAIDITLRTGFGKEKCDELQGTVPGG